MLYDIEGYFKHIKTGKLETAIQQGISDCAETQGDQYFRGHWTQLWEGKKLEKAGTSFLFWGGQGRPIFWERLE